MALDEELFRREVQQAISLYEAVERQLRSVIANRSATAFQRAQTATLLEQVTEIVERLRQGQISWFERVLPRAYRAGQESASQALARDLPTWSQINQQQVDALIARMSVDSNEALQSIAPRLQAVFVDAQQQVVHAQALYREIATGMVEGLTPQDLTKRITQTLRDGATERLKGYLPDDLRSRLQETAEGRFITIHCKDGKDRTYSLRSYGELVARTAPRFAATEGAISTAHEARTDLVQISVHNGACPALCLPIQGKIFSISGTDTRFPVLTPEVRPPLHPRCGHIITPVVEEFLVSRGIIDRLAEFSRGKSGVANIPEYHELVHAQPAGA